MEAMGKSPWRSKTLWVNALALAAMLVQHYTGTDYLDPETQTGILAVVNLVLRVLTKEPLVTGSGSGRILGLCLIALAWPAGLWAEPRPAPVGDTRQVACTRPDPRSSGLVGDGVVGAGEAAPACAALGVWGDASRPWVAPLDPGVPPPDPRPVPTSPPPPPPDGEPVRAVRAARGPS